MRTRIIEVVDKCRYVTAGDYFNVDDVTIIQVVKQVRPEYEFLIALHELFEQFAAELAGIQEPDIMKWDIENPHLDEPGEHPDAPYHKQHMDAEKIERMCAKMLNIDWGKYEQEIIVSE